MPHSPARNRSWNRPAYVAGGGGGSAFFTDDFSSGDFTKTGGGFSWSGNANSVVISGFGPNGKNNCVRFNMDIGAGGVSDARYLTAVSYTHLTLPTNREV